ncbi:MAG: DODA-type extradiol aromatic ring-opening family dioxygenase [Symbiobacteriia bacterium]
MFACIVPHGGECLPEFATEDPQRAARTRAAMAEIGRRLEALQPDTVIIVNPHGISVPAAFCLPLGEAAVGHMTEGASGNGGEDDDGGAGDSSGPVIVAGGFAMDIELGWDLACRIAQRDLPVAPAFFPPGSPVPLDWGALIPLYYLGRSFKKPPRVVLLTPTRDLPLAANVAVGEALAEVAEQSGQRVAFIASADQGHSHQAEGPYGFDEKSAEYDRFFCDAVEANDLGRLLQVSDELIERGQPDSLWQALMLHGAVQRVPMQGKLLSYEVPTYFGMACAMYEPKQRRPHPRRHP